MNLRHAAALALVGWYLMLLPRSEAGPEIFAEPWDSIQASFDTAKECEEARAKAVVELRAGEQALAKIVIPPKEIETQPSAAPSPETPGALTRLFGVTEPSAVATAKAAEPLKRSYFCVATDDPRLKGP